MGAEKLLSQTIERGLAACSCHRSERARGLGSDEGAVGTKPGASPGADHPVRVTRVASGGHLRNLISEHIGSGAAAAPWVVTFRDRAGRLRAVPHDRQRADSNDLRHCGQAVSQPLGAIPQDARSHAAAKINPWPVSHVSRSYSQLYGQRGTRQGQGPASARCPRLDGRPGSCTAGPGVPREAAARDGPGRYGRRHARSGRAAYRLARARQTATPPPRPQRGRSPRQCLGGDLQFSACLARATVNSPAGLLSWPRMLTFGS